MDTEVKQLQVGDVVYKVYSRTPSGKFTIERVTEKRAFAPGYQFEREYHEGRSLREIGGISGKYSSSSYYAETQEWKERFEHKEICDRLSTKNMAYFSLEILRQVDKLLHVEKP